MQKTLPFMPGSKEHFPHLPGATQEILRELAKKYKAGKVEYKKILKDIKSSRDLRSISIEDAVVLLFMLISEDAAKDLKDILDKMDEARLKKKALRVEEILLEKESDGLRKKMRKQAKSKLKAEDHSQSLQKAIKKHKKYLLENENPQTTFTI